MEQEKVNRINELARKAKSIGLSDSERAEQKQLREDYIAGFRASLANQLDNTYIVEPDGTKHRIKPKE